MSGLFQRRYHSTMVTCCTTTRRGHSHFTAFTYCTQAIPTLKDYFFIRLCSGCWNHWCFESAQYSFLWIKSIEEWVLLLWVVLSVSLSPHTPDKVDAAADSLDMFLRWALRFKTELAALIRAVKSRWKSYDKRRRHKEEQLPQSGLGANAVLTAKRSPVRHCRGDYSMIQMGHSMFKPFSMHKSTQYSAQGAGDSGFVLYPSRSRWWSHLLPTVFQLYPVLSRLFNG